MIRLGVDILEVDRVIGRNRTPRTAFLRQVVLPAGVDRLPKGVLRSLAARLAAKEAVAKALGTGIGDVGWKEIEIVSGPRGEPELSFWQGKTAGRGSGAGALERQPERH